MRRLPRAPSDVAEERDLAARHVFLRERRFVNRRVERGRELRAVAAERVERAGVDQRFEHALVAAAQVDAVAEVEERL